MAYVHSVRVFLSAARAVERVRGKKEKVCVRNGLFVEEEVPLLGQQIASSTLHIKAALPSE